MSHVIQIRPQHFYVMLLTDRQTDKQTNSGENITSLAEVIKYQTNARRRPTVGLCAKIMMKLKLNIGLS